MHRCSKCGKLRQLKDGLCGSCRGEARNPEQQKHAKKKGDKK